MNINIDDKYIKLISKFIIKNFTPKVLFQNSRIKSFIPKVLLKKSLLKKMSLQKFYSENSAPKIFIN